jgi:hypothetical protein
VLLGEHVTDIEPASGQTAQAVELLGQQRLPLPLNTYSVDASGNILKTERDRLSFSFAFLGTRFDASAALGGVNKLNLDLTADLGPLPFSVESRMARSAVLDMVAAGEFGFGRFSIAKNQMIRVEGTVPIEQPLTPVALLTALTAFLLDLKPHLDSFAQQVTTVWAKAHPAKLAEAAVGPA